MTGNISDYAASNLLCSEAKSLFFDDPEAVTMVKGGHSVVSDVSKEVLSSQNSSNLNTATTADIEIVGDENVDDASMEAEVEEINPFARKKRKKTSKVWDEFKEVIVGKIPKLQCIHCKLNLSKINSGATSHLLRHLKGCTLRKINMRGQQQLSVSTASAKTESLAAVQNFVYEQEKVREIFSHMILVHELPFNFAEYELFNLLMRTATPNWEKISRATLRKDCFSSYESQKRKIQSLLDGANRVSITTDLWTSDQKMQYMVVTAHCVDISLTLQKRILSFISVPPPHTGIVIADTLHKCLIEWGIDKKVWTVTVDNASCNDVAVKTLKEILKYGNNLPLDGKFFHVRCCAHILNILVQEGMSEIGDVIHNVRESVKYIGMSVSRLHIFGEIVKQLNLPKKKLILDCCTRWNATYAMLVVALEYKDVFPHYQQRDLSYHHLPSEDDWKKAAVVCSFLEQFEVVTNIISGSEYPTSNLFLPELWQIKKILDDALLSDDSCRVAMASKMQKKFDKYWSDCNLLISLAAILDPRNKIKFIDFAFGELYSSVDAITYSCDVQSNLRELYDEYVESYKSMVVKKQVEIENQASSSKSSSLGKGKTGRAKFDNMMRDVETISAEKSELDVYLEEKNVLHNEEIDPPFDVLSWWRSQSSKFRILSKMACDILSIPITTVASESAFSAGGRVIEPHRASLGVDTVQMLMCGSDWLRAHYSAKKNKVGDDLLTYELPI